jgi:hypothetical protein
MKRWPVLFVFSMAVAAAMASEAPISKLAPPGTKVAIGINVRGLLDSSLAKNFGQEQALAAKLTSSQEMAGFDVLKDLDQVLILSTGSGQNAPTLIIAHGRFDVEKLAAGAKKYHDVPVVGSPKTGSGVFALLDGENVIAGEPDLVRAAIDRLGSGDQLDADLLARIDAARQKYDLWGIGDCPDGLAAPGEGADALRAIDKFAFGAALRQGLELTAEIHARTSEDAAKMTAAIGLLEAALKMQAKDSDIKFDVHSDNGTLKISLSMSEEELRKAIETQRATLTSAMTQHAGNGVRNTSAEAAAPEAALPPVAESSAPALESAAPVALSMDAKPDVSLVPVVTKPIRPEAKTQVVKAPNGDTLFLKLPGAK